MTTLPSACPQLQLNSVGPKKTKHKGIKIREGLVGKKELGGHGVGNDVRYIHVSNHLRIINIKKEKRMVPGSKSDFRCLVWLKKGKEKSPTPLALHLSHSLSGDFLSL